jgi:hypothetical protein
MPKLKSEPKPKVKSEPKPKVKNEPSTLSLGIPAPGMFSEQADNQGTVTITMTIPTADGSIVSKINIKVDGAYSAGAPARNADFTVEVSRVTLDQVLFNADANADDDPFAKANIAATATANHCPYHDGWPCVEPVDPQCSDGDMQKAFQLSATLQGAIFNVTAKLTKYLVGDTVSGTIYLLRDDV